MQTDGHATSSVAGSGECSMFWKVLCCCCWCHSNRTISRVAPVRISKMSAYILHVPISCPLPWWTSLHTAPALPSDMWITDGAHLASPSLSENVRQPTVLFYNSVPAGGRNLQVPRLVHAAREQTRKPGRKWRKFDAAVVIMRYTSL